MAEDAGLPMGNITALVAGKAERLWVGTTMGVALRQLGGDPPWRYLFGPRWLTDNAVRAMAAAGDGVVVVGERGVSWLAREAWTLERKAAAFETMLRARHDRHGMVAECGLASFGDVSAPVTQADNDNNGLWTSLVVGAEYMRYAVTREPEALQSASTYLRGMVLLNNVTGVAGLVARSACGPAEKGVTCHTNPTDGHWVNSSAPGYAGWIWKRDASSDEVVGHAFAFSVAARLSPLPDERALAAKLLTDLVGGIVRNGAACAPPRSAHAARALPSRPPRRAPQTTR